MKRRSSHRGVVMPLGPFGRQPFRSRDIEISFGTFGDAVQFLTKESIIPLQDSQLSVFFDNLGLGCFQGALNILSRCVRTSEMPEMPAQSEDLGPIIRVPDEKFVRIEVLKCFCELAEIAVADADQLSKRYSLSGVGHATENSNCFTIRDTAFESIVLGFQEKNLSIEIQDLNDILRDINADMGIKQSSIFSVKTFNTIESPLYRAFTVITNKNPIT